MTKDPLGRRLLTIFIGELEEQVRVMNTALLALEKGPGDSENLKTLFRVAHTLKGAARAAGVPQVEQACHAIETLLAEARDGDLILGSKEFTQLFSAADALADAGRRLKANEELPDAPILGFGFRARRRRSKTDRKEVPEKRAPAAAVAAARVDHSVKVEAEDLDGLVAVTGQLLMASGAVSNRPADVQALHEFAVRWAAEWGRVGRRLRLTLEKSGGIPALLHVVNGMGDNVQRLLRETTRLANGAREEARVLAQVTDALAVGVRRLRLQPVSEACEALPRAVRDVASTARKEVDLAILTGDARADRAVVSGLREALLHLVRNAVDHGIESPTERVRLGKSRRGKITVAAEIRGDRLTVSVADDGAGLNASQIRAVLARKGLSVPKRDDELAWVLFSGGLSTRKDVTAISGRGVGLDLVRAAVDRIRGIVTVTWTPGHGTTFTLECPPALATIPALLARVGSQVVAIPTSEVERLARVRPEEVNLVEGRSVLAAPPGPPVPMVTLAQLLPPLVGRPATGPLSVILLRVGERRLAVVVDELLAEQEIVLQPVWRGRQALPSVGGAAILGGGQVVIALDAPAVIAAGLKGDSAGGLVAGGEERKVGKGKRKILVADDSITTRALEQSILEAAGYEVTTAVDGADAWKALHDRGCDLVVADVEMPRMDGFALCEAIRGSKRFRDLPVVLVTALETPENRLRGLEAGADAYVSKSTFDQKHLLNTISQLLGVEST